jgi:hypothetical protein
MLDFLNPWFLMPRLSECAGDPPAGRALAAITDHQFLLGGWV